MKIGFWSTFGLFATIISPAVGQTVERYFDPHGNATGRLDREGARLIEKDRNGNGVGYFVKDGDRIEHRDMNGNRLDYSRPTRR